MRKAQVKDIFEKEILPPLWEAAILPAAVPIGQKLHQDSVWKGDMRFMKSITSLFVNIARILNAVQCHF